jgi:hypothetical protein|nr:MAG TPA: Protein of unknown function (DUF551) [Caudoviricetes sp.]
MSRVRTRLEQYKAEIEKKSQYKHGLPGSALDIVNTLLDDFEQDEKENGWIPVSERLPEDDTTVLVSCKTRRGTTFVRAGYCIYGSWHLNCEGVEAWKPLPEPYKED